MDAAKCEAAWPQPAEEAASSVPETRFIVLKRARRKKIAAHSVFHSIHTRANALFYYYFLLHVCMCESS